MGAKAKPQETLTAADVGGARRPRRRCSRSAPPPARGERGRSRTTAPAPRRSSSSSSRRGSLMAKMLVFLEHHEGAMRRARSACSRRRRRSAARSPACSSARASRARRERGRVGAATVCVADDARLAAPLPQPRVDVLAKLVRDEGFDAVLFAQSVLAADVAAGLAARLDAGLNWDLVDLDGESRARRRRSRTPSTSTSAGRAPVALAIFRAGTFDAGESAAPPRSGTRGRARGLLDARRAGRAGARRAAGRRSRTPT